VIDSFSAPTINHATEHKKGVMHLICVQLWGSLGMETSAIRKECITSMRECIAIIQLLRPSHTEYLITYYSCAFYFQQVSEAFGWTRNNSECFFV